MDLGLTWLQANLIYRFVFTLAPTSLDYIRWCEALGYPEDVNWLEKRKLIEYTVHRGQRARVTYILGTGIYNDSDYIFHSFGGLPQMILHEKEVGMDVWYDHYTNYGNRYSRCEYLGIIFQLKYFRKKRIEERARMRKESALKKLKK